MVRNTVDTESDAWSTGNVIYVHGCTMRISDNWLVGANKREHKKVSMPNLINFYDSNIDMVRNEIVNNTRFLYIINVGVPHFPKQTSDFSALTRQCNANALTLCHCQPLGRWEKALLAHSARGKCVQGAGGVWGRVGKLGGWRPLYHCGPGHCMYRI